MVGASGRAKLQRIFRKLRKKDVARVRAHLHQTSRPSMTIVIAFNGKFVRFLLVFSCIDVCTYMSEMEEYRGLSFGIFGKILNSLDFFIIAVLK